MVTTERKTRIRARLAAIATCLGLLAAPALAQDQALIDAARKEGKVIWYTGLIVNQIVRPLCDAFQAKYGVQAGFARHDENELALTFNNEVRAKRIQVDVMGSAAGIIDQISPAQMEVYRPASAADYPAQYSTPDGIWWATNSIIHTVAINTNLVKPADVPRTYQDLLDPKWRGKLAWTSSLSASGPPGYITAVLSDMGEGPGMDFLRKLAAQKLTNIPGTPRAVLDQVIAGEFPMALQIVSYHASLSAAQGAPTAWLKLEPAIENYNYVGVVKNAPHPNAARLFVDFVLSREGQEVFSKAGYIPANPAIPAGYPDTKPADGHFRTVLLTPELAQAHYQQAVKIYNELFK